MNISGSTNLIFLKKSKYSDRKMCLSLLFLTFKTWFNWLRKCRSQQEKGCYTLTVFLMMSWLKKHILRTVHTRFSSGKHDIQGERLHGSSLTILICQRKSCGILPLTRADGFQKLGVRNLKTKNGIMKESLCHKSTRFKIHCYCLSQLKKFSLNETARTDHNITFKPKLGLTTRSGTVWLSMN